jgi:hypothetical protein
MLCGPVEGEVVLPEWTDGAGEDVLEGTAVRVE